MVNNHRVEFVSVPSLDGRIVRATDQVLGEQGMLILSVAGYMAH